jgi:hypothetical protein
MSKTVVEFLRLHFTNEAESGQQISDLHDLLWGEELIIMSISGYESMTVFNIVTTLL